MYEKVNITENHMQVLSLFTGDLGSGFYIREVKRLLGISPRTAQIILDDLESRGILESKTRGKIKSYTLKTDAIVQRYIVFAEQYKTISFLGKGLMVREIIGKITPSINGIGVVFGSYAKGTSSKGSDLDVFVAGEYDAAAVKRVSRTYGIEISVKCYPLKTFEGDIAHDPLLKEIIKNHYVFLGAELFVRTVFKHG